MFSSSVKSGDFPNLVKPVDLHQEYEDYRKFVRSLRGKELLMMILPYMEEHVSWMLGEGYYDFHTAKLDLIIIELKRRLKIKEV